MEHRHDTGWVYYRVSGEARGQGLASGSLASAARWGFPSDTASARSTVKWLGTRPARLPSDLRALPGLPRLLSAILSLDGAIQEKASVEELQDRRC